MTSENSRVMRERGGGIGCKDGEYAWIGKKRKGQVRKKRGAGEVRFLPRQRILV